MTLDIGKLILVLVVIGIYVCIFSLCKVSGDAERRYEELAAKKFASQGGDTNAI